MLFFPQLIPQPKRHSLVSRTDNGPAAMTDEPAALLMFTSLSNARIRERSWVAIDKHPPLALTMQNKLCSQTLLLAKALFVGIRDGPLLSTQLQALRPIVAKTGGQAA